MGIKTNNLEITGGITLNGVNIFDIIYPIGSLYLSVTNTNPGTLFGGTWEQIKDQFLLASGDTYNNGATGGSANHSHGTSLLYAGVTNYSGVIAFENRQNVDTWTSDHIISWSGTVSEPQASNNYTQAVKIHGTTDSATNMPPYLVVYMWKRTA